MKVLVLTSVLPVEGITHKQNENNIILETERHIKYCKEDFEYHYIYIQPYTNWILSLFSSKWKEYYSLGKQKQFSLNGRVIHVISVLMLPTKTKFRSFFYNISWLMIKKRIEDILIQNKVEIVHAQDSDVSSFLGAKLKKKFTLPLIITLRGVNFHFDFLTKKYLTYSNHLLAISSIQKSIVTKHGFSNKTTLIPHGVSNKFFNSKVSKSYKSTIRFVVVARLIKLKNIDKVIKAFIDIDEGATFDIYGDGPERKFLEDLVNDKGIQDRVFFNGYVENDQLPRVLSNFDVFIMPSYPETLGRVYFEAMACGLPVIACKNTGIDGIIENNCHGFLIEPKISEIESTVVKFLNNPEILLEMSKSAYELSKKFKWENVAVKYLEIYDNVLKG